MMIIFFDHCLDLNHVTFRPCNNFLQAHSHLLDRWPFKLHSRLHMYITYYLIKMFVSVALGLYCVRGLQQSAESYTKKI